MILSIEQWIHVRESIDRHLKLLEESNPQQGSPFNDLKLKKIASLTDARRQVNQEINDLQFEANRNISSFVHDTDPD